MHQVGLHENIEMHGQQNVKKYKTAVATDVMS